MYGDIRDENDLPIVGVKIVVTDPDNPSVSMEFESDKRGRYTIFVPNSLPRYAITLTKAGFQEKQLAGIKIPARARMRGNLSMTSQAFAQAAMKAANPDDAPQEAEGGGYVGL